MAYKERFLKGGESRASIILNGLKRLTVCTRLRLTRRFTQRCELKYMNFGRHIAQELLSYNLESFAAVQRGQP